MPCRKPNVWALEPESVMYHVAISPLLLHPRSHLKYKHHPEVTQVTPDHPEWAAVWGLTLKDRWHEGNSFIPWVGRDSASDVSVYGQQKVFFVNCFLMHAYNQIEHLKGRRGRNLLTVLCEELNTFFFNESRWKGNRFSKIFVTFAIYFRFIVTGYSFQYAAMLCPLLYFLLKKIDI